jgi:type II secretory pathway component PulJ
MKKIIKNQLNRQAGFTVVEVMTATIIFSVILISIAGIFVQALNLERKTFAAQKIQENVLRSFEIMAREMRVSQITSFQPGSYCQYTSLNLNSSLEDTDVTYALNDSGQITRNEESITSGEVEFSNLRFCVRGLGADDEPARITIVSEVKDKKNPQYLIKVQTTITSRDVRDDFQN